MAAQAASTLNPNFTFSGKEHVLFQTERRCYQWLALLPIAWEVGGQLTGNLILCHPGELPSFTQRQVWFGLKPLCMLSGTGAQPLLEALSPKYNILILSVVK